MIPLPTSLSLGASSSASGRSDQTTGDLRSGQGFRSSVINNFALDGSKLSASTSGAGGIPTWALWAGGACVLGFLAWQYVRK